VAHPKRQGGPRPDPVEQALADALTLAAQAGRFDTVEVLSRDLTVRRLARVAPDVPSLEAERAKRSRYDLGPP
jgi:hypothetical protein